MDEQNLQPSVTIQSLNDANLAAPAALQAPAVQVAVANAPAENEKISYADAQVEEIDITRISPDPFQPRKVFQAEALKELATSIKEYGVIQPIVVSKTPAGFELIVGERRLQRNSPDQKPFPPLLKQNWLTRPSWKWRL